MLMEIERLQRGVEGERANLQQMVEEINRRDEQWRKSNEQLRAERQTAEGKVVQSEEETKKLKEEIVFFQAKLREAENFITEMEHLKSFELEAESKVQENGQLQEQVKLL